MPAAVDGTFHARAKRPGKSGLNCIYSRHSTFALPAGAAALLAGCAGPQSALDPQGPVAADIALSWWVMLIGGTVILIAVMALVLYAMFRKPPRHPPATVSFLVWAGVVIPVVALTALLVYGTDLGRRITQSAEDPLRIEITAHQWWWEVRYPQGHGPEVITANELRLPVDVPVEIVLTSADVIHSFWIPNLGGKIDMIPGRTNVLRLAAGAPGRFNAQCSEFCGAQHARMGFLVIAEPVAQFDAWRNGRAATASLDGEDTGLLRFMQLGCGSCHAIAGTSAAGSGGPVLTHFADRPTLGGRTAVNSAPALRAWLRDHGQAMKPGSHGPTQRRLEAADVEIIAQLLEQLH